VEKIADPSRSRNKTAAQGGRTSADARRFVNDRL
jgi:hypothetical protein